MSLVWLASPALIAGVGCVVFSGRPMIRNFAVLIVSISTFYMGVQFEKLLFVNRHIDMCADETAAYFRENGAFDPYCEILHND